MPFLRVKVARCADCGNVNTLTSIVRFCAIELNLGSVFIYYGVCIVASCVNDSVTRVTSV